MTGRRCNNETSRQSLTNRMPRKVPIASARPHPSQVVPMSGRIDQPLRCSSSSLRPVDYEKHAPEPCVRYLHGCRTKVPSLHRKPGDFQAIRSTTRSSAVDSAPTSARRLPLAVPRARRRRPEGATGSRWIMSRTTCVLGVSGVSVRLAHGDGMGRPPPQPPDYLDQVAASIPEPEVPAGDERDRAVSFW